ncbi:MAG: DUF4388 domain-containing protein [Deltaproteobacteria bacterium]|nr:DUF4388 domain-containing protein [Deltaproteobacteria bacterium]
MTDDLERLAESAAAHPDDAWGWLRLAQAFLAAGAVVPARHVLERAIDQAKEERQLYEELAQALEQLEDWDRALTAWQKAVALGPGAEAHLAGLLLRRGAPEEALQVARRGLVREPNAAELLELEARAHLGLRAPAEALRPAERAVTHSARPQLAERRRLLARIYQTLGRAEDRLAVLRQQEDEQLSDVGDRLDLCEALLERRSIAEAAQVVATLGGDGLLPLPLELRLSELAARAGLPGVAVGRLEQLVQHDASPLALSAYGAALVEAGRPLEAVAPLRQSLEHSPEQARARHALGRALVRLGAHREATSHLVKAAAMEPEDERVRADLAEALQTPSPTRQTGLVGDLRLFTVPDLLQLLAQLRATGRLEIQTERGRATVWLIGGRLLDAQDERFEPLHLAVSNLGPEAERVLAGMSPDDRTRGPLLLSALSRLAPPLQRSLAQLLFERTLRSLGPVLELREGQATFVPDASEVRVDEALLVPVEHAVLEASRRSDESRLE